MKSWRTTTAGLGLAIAVIVQAIAEAMSTGFSEETAAKLGAAVFVALTGYFARDDKVSSEGTLAPKAAPRAGFRESAGWLAIVPLALCVSSCMGAPDMGPGLEVHDVNRTVFVQQQSYSLDLIERLRPLRKDFATTEAFEFAMADYERKVAIARGDMTELLRLYDQGHEELGRLMSAIGGERSVVGRVAGTVRTGIDEFKSRGDQ